MNIKIGNQTYSIPTIALGLMLSAILAPSVKYSLNLYNPSAAELLVAISIALFSSVLFLWILDATSILKFRSAWISKSIYGAAIVSVIGTSVGVYKDYFDPNKYPYSGKWIISVLNKNDSNFILNNNIALVYSEHSKLYWGYTDIQKNGVDSSVAITAEMIQFDEKSYEATLK
ncbi:MAG: hypothetical protein V4722_01995 [Bacteroidota bacterium]